MRNGQRWIVSIGIGAIGGLVMLATDPTPPSTWDIIRHCLIGIGTVLPALKMTLNPDEK